MKTYVEGPLQHCMLYHLSLMLKYSLALEYCFLHFFTHPCEAVQLLGSKFGRKSICHCYRPTTAHFVQLRSSCIAFCTIS